jgi:glyoxylase-like metal-dependent hydrolase (beta-lactamase superfamily II)
VDADVRISENLHRIDDTCNVYLLKSGRDAVLIDFGGGSILDRLEEHGVDRITDVLLTHHHRDQAQGLSRAVAHGARIWVPPVEQDLFADVEPHWQARTLANDYNPRQDRFSILESIPITGTLPEYRHVRFGSHTMYVLPTPGHTIGSISLFGLIDERDVAFTGDLIAGQGKVWSLAATQWTYNGAEGVGASILSALAVRDRDADVLLPSHGEPIPAPRQALDLLVERLRRLLAVRGGPIVGPDILELRERPFIAVSPHLLLNRTSTSYSYVLLSDTGRAMVLDYGYDFTTGLPAGTDRAARRPWLYTLEALKRDWGVDRIDVAIPTHYHDDHVAGFNLLREVEGTRIWAGTNVAGPLMRPERYDLPCLWYDPIPVDRAINSGTAFRWAEYELTMYDLPGHTRHAVAIDTTIDGRRVLASGDQQDGGWFEGRPEHLNYTYPNRFAVGDYRASAELYLRLRPEMMISGHWPPREVNDEYLDYLLDRGAELERVHRDLLPLDVVDLGATGVAARIEPYRLTVPLGGAARLTALVRNPHPRPERVTVTPVLPDGWAASPTHFATEVPAGANVQTSFHLRVTRTPVRRARVALDVAVGERRFGQAAESFVTVGERRVLQPAPVVVPDAEPMEEPTAEPAGSLLGMPNFPPLVLDPGAG